MRIRLSYASPEELMRQCEVPLRMGILFLPAYQMASAGTVCQLIWSTEPGNEVLRAEGLIVGASALEEDGQAHQGLWVRVLAFLYVANDLAPWLEGLRTWEYRPAPAAPVPEAAKGRPRAPGQGSARPMLPEPEAADEDLGWLGHKFV
jgi:hypothetical protein